MSQENRLDGRTQNYSLDIAVGVKISLTGFFGNKLSKPKKRRPIQSTPLCWIRGLIFRISHPIKTNSYYEC